MREPIVKEYRTDRDSLGEVRIPSEVYWGAQTQRAIENFPVSGIPMPHEFIHALALVKKACALVNGDLHLLDAELTDAIVRACDEITDGKYSDQFPVDIFQTGSGTSTNMNMNEVIAARANELLTGKRQNKSPVHPNDHVNKCQSSNDIIPTAIHVSARLRIPESLLPALDLLRTTIEKKQRQYSGVVKTGRTHLMDAMPLTLEQELSGWSAQVEHAVVDITGTLSRLEELAVGGTAVGTGVNAPAEFGARVAAKLSDLTKIKFRETANHFEAQSMQNAVVNLSGQLKTFASGLFKIANDLRWMNSGPLTGLSEIRLPELQPGSSIMPGKVNPVIPEAVRMVCVRVMGNDAVLGMANALGDFELNMMFPLIAHTILESIGILANASRLLAEKAMRDFEVDEDHIAEFLERNPILATVLNPRIGYDRSAEVVKKAVHEKKTVKQSVVELGYLDTRDADEIINPARMTAPERVHHTQKERS